MVWLLTPFFASNNLGSTMLAALLIGAVCGIIGTFVISRGMEFLGDALTQAIFPGVVIALFLYLGSLIGAVSAAALTVVGIGLISRYTWAGWETAIGVVVAGTFAGGILLFSRLPRYPNDLTTILIGDVFGIPSVELVSIEILAALIVIVLLILYREFLLVSFDPNLAVAQGWPAAWLDRALLLLLTATVIMSLNVTGTIFVVPLIVTPSATARFWAQRFWLAMFLGGLLGAFSTASGLYLSYRLRAPSGATIVLIASVIFLISLIVAPKRGWLARRSRP